jgi:hypothetical protein
VKSEASAYVTQRKATERLGFVNWSRRKAFRNFFV